MTYEEVFAYPTKYHVQLHGPFGYTDYKSFKPWLRDEFQFRCVYCLWREAWSPNGDSSFGVDHLLPRATHPHRYGEYDNLIYACSGCNSVKQHAPLPIHPLEVGLGNHLESISDGQVQGITAIGREFIKICRLNRPVLVRARWHMRLLLQELVATDTNRARLLLRGYLSYPRNLPILSSLRPPGGNTRLEGIAASYFERRKRGELPETY